MRCEGLQHGLNAPVPLRFQRRRPPSNSSFRFPHGSLAHRAQALPARWSALRRFSEGSTPPAKQAGIFRHALARGRRRPGTQAEGVTPAGA
jgi:hypothetical protein